MTSAIADLQRRLGRAIQSGRAIQLSPVELDLFVISGAYERLSTFAVAEQMAIVRQRMAERKGAEDE